MRKIRCGSREPPRESKHENYVPKLCGGGVLRRPLRQRPQPPPPTWFLSEQGVGKLRRSPQRCRGAAAMASRDPRLRAPSAALRHAL